MPISVSKLASQESDLRLGISKFIAISKTFWGKILNSLLENFALELVPEHEARISWNLS